MDVPAVIDQPAPVAGIAAGELRGSGTVPVSVPPLPSSGTGVVAREKSSGTQIESVPLLETSGGTDNPIEDFAREILERSDDGKLESAGWRIEIQRKPSGRRYWRWCKGGRKNRVREYPTVGGTFAILESLYPDRAAKYRPRHKPIATPRELGADHRRFGD